MPLKPGFLAGGLLTLLLLVAAGWLAMKRDAVQTSVEAVRTEPLMAGAFSPPHEAPDFELEGSNGTAITLSSYRGQVVLLTFGFTNCAAVCPTTLATLAQARKRLGAAGDGVQVLYVTVDPDRDGTAKMKEYLAAFDPTFVGATGKPDVLAAVRQKYGVTATKQGSGPDYAMAHTSSIFLIDRAGMLRALMPFGHDAADFVHDIRYLSAH